MTRVCRRCKVELNLASFGSDRGQKDGIAKWCKACKAEYARVWCRTHPDQTKERHRRFRKSHPEVIREFGRRAYYKDHEATKAKRRVQNQALRDKWRAEVFAAYGGKCVCCGESEPRFLTVEHTNRDGKHHRISSGGWNRHYFDIIKRGFPRDLTLLCMNCNWAERTGVPCPHKTQKAEP